MTAVAKRRVELATYEPPPRSWDDARRGLPLASFARRGVALALDFLFAGILILGLVLGGGTLAVDLGWLHLDKQVMLELKFFGNWYSVVWLAVCFGFGAWLGNGQTLGKRLCRIRSVSIAHDKLGLGHSLERALGYGASLLEFGFGFFQYFLRPDRRTVHDRMAETIVIALPPRRRTGDS